MKMHVLSGGRLRVRKTMYDSSAVRGETIEVRGAMVLCGRDDAQWVSLRKGADAYE